jgi:hypothetical protein
VVALPDHFDGEDRLCPTIYYGIDTLWEGWRKPPFQSGAMIAPAISGDIGGPAP